MDSANSFQLDKSQRNYYQEEKCFNLCIKNFQGSLIKQEEKRCLNGCFAKLKMAQKLYLQKFNETMEYLALVDPALRAKFASNNQNNKP